MLSVSMHAEVLRSSGRMPPTAKGLLSPEPCLRTAILPALVPGPCQGAFMMLLRPPKR